MPVKPGDLVTPGDAILLTTFPSPPIPGLGLRPHPTQPFHHLCTLTGTLTHTPKTNTLHIVPPPTTPQPPIPSLKSIITGRVTRVNPRSASVSILAVDDIVIDEEKSGGYKGVVRLVDVRLEEVDKVVMYKAFRPGDIVRAKVISLGDKFAYYLSTAENELGVVYAVSEGRKGGGGGKGDVGMVPVSWSEMQCPVTRVKEFRKVAKV